MLTQTVQHRDIDRWERRWALQDNELPSWNQGLTVTSGTGSTGRGDLRDWGLSHGLAAFRSPSARQWEFGCSIMEIDVIFSLIDSEVTEIEMP